MTRGSLPSRVEIREVCPRDGFQSVKEKIFTKDKIALIDAMAETGVSVMEVTSFVSPKAIPQMSDASEVMTHFNERWSGKVKSVVLVPNVKGAENALKVSPDSLNFVLSASASHNRANTRRTIEESLAELKEVKSLCGDVELGLSVATSFQCPFEGAISPDAVVNIVEKAMEIGVGTVTLADTIGTCDPVYLSSTLSQIKKVFGDYPFFLHLHDTHGMAMVNTMVAMEMGFYRFDSATGGLGGCPFAPGAAGNSATEDMVNFFDRVGVSSGVDLERVLAIADRMKTMGLPVNSHMSSYRAGCSSLSCEG